MQQNTQAFRQLLLYYLTVWVISGFRRGVGAICALLLDYAAYRCNSLPTFRDNPPVPSSRVKKFSSISWPLKMEPMGCPETSERNYNYMLRNITEERTSHLTIYLLRWLTICITSNFNRHTLWYIGLNVATANTHWILWVPKKSLWDCFTVRWSPVLLLTVHGFARFSSW